MDSTELLPNETALSNRPWFREPPRHNARYPPLVSTAYDWPCWEVGIRIFKIPTFVVPTPSAIVWSLIDNRGALAIATKATAAEILRFASSFVGVAVALVIVRFERFGRALLSIGCLVSERAKGRAGTNIYSLVWLQFSAQDFVDRRYRVFLLRSTCSLDCNRCETIVHCTYAFCRRKLSLRFCDGFVFAFACRT